MYLFHNKASFYGKELLAPRSTPKLENNPLLALSDCLFNIFAATHHIGSLYSIRNLRTCRAVVTGTRLSRNFLSYGPKIKWTRNRWVEHTECISDLFYALYSSNHEVLSNSTEKKTAKYMFRICLNKITREPSRKMKIIGKGNIRSGSE